MHKPFTISAALAALALLGSVAVAQTPPPAPPPAHHGFLHNLFHHNKPVTTGTMPSHSLPNHSMMGGTSAISGGIIGNKKSHVYHLAGDKGALPDPKNRVYFHTAAAAEAAGYHRAGSQHAASAHHTTVHAKPMMAPGHTMGH